jgi:hypothetical protein
MTMWPFKRKPKPKVFTGNCMVRQHTMDGHYIGRCYHSTYNGVCHVHGDVSVWLCDPSMTLWDWPNDYDREQP